jgi:uncharacterized protein involved in type VI secretion and phage assembly
LDPRRYHAWRRWIRSPEKVGDEVIVGFLEGDPDQPIILGTVPNVER